VTPARRGGRSAPVHAVGFRWRRLIALAVFVVAMAFIEAMVVVYLRKVFALQFDLRVTAKDFHFPKQYLRREQAREVATIVMLLAVAFMFGRSWWERLGAYLFAFGVWDVFYYVWLFVLLGWPQSPTARDMLFLIPGEWVAPVWQPLAASLVMIAAALLVFAKKGSSART
jgi:hypothetical protein